VIPWKLTPEPLARPRVCAVEYLNTVPLVWGMLHGPQRDLFELSFALPSACADRLASGDADIGIVPVAALLDQRLEILRGCGIASRGAVRSILLVSQCEPSRIRRLAADAGSRSSVLLARIVLADRHGAEPEVVARPPRLPDMLAEADAALIIGDPALRLDPAALPYRVLDLGAEWTGMTGLPMVFAVWAARPGVATPAIEAAFVDSCRFGLDRVGDIVRAEAPARGIPEALASEYLTRRIVFELGERDYAGMSRYLSEAARLDKLVAHR
jgi:chorismate dehydratase